MDFDNLLKFDKAIQKFIKFAENQNVYKNSKKRINLDVMISQLKKIESAGF